MFKSSHSNCFIPAVRKYGRWSFALSPATRLLLCGLVPNRLWTSLVCDLGIGDPWLRQLKKFDQSCLHMMNKRWLTFGNSLAVQWLGFYTLTGQVQYSVLRHSQKKEKTYIISPLWIISLSSFSIQDPKAQQLQFFPLSHSPSQKEKMTNFLVVLLLFENSHTPYTHFCFQLEGIGSMPCSWYVTSFLGRDVSQTVLPGPAAWRSPGHVLLMNNLGTLDLQNQQLWEWSPATCVLISLPDDSDACSSLKPHLVFLHVVLLSRHDWLSHWPLVIELSFYPFFSNPINHVVSSSGDQLPSRSYLGTCVG